MAKKNAEEQIMVRQVTDVHANWSKRAARLASSRSNSSWTMAPRSTLYVLRPMTRTC